MCKINNYEFSHVLLGMQIYCFEFWVRYLLGLDSFITFLKEISNFYNLFLKRKQYLQGQSSLPFLKISHSWVQKMGRVSQLLNLWMDQSCKDTVLLQGQTTVN